MLFITTDTLSIKDKKLFEVQIRLFFRAITSEVPTPKVWKFQHLFQHSLYPTALKDCQGIVFTHGVWMGGLAAVSQKP